MLGEEERWRQILSSLVVCFFARGIYKPEIVLNTLDLAGFHLTAENLDRIGEEIHRKKYGFKIREGFSLENSKIPERILETHTPAGKLDESYIKKVLKSYNKLLDVDHDIKL